MSSTIIERAILSRSFFSKDQLLVALVDDQVEAWCHFGRPADPEDDLSEFESGHHAILSAICFTATGLKCCDDLLAAAQTRMAEFGCENVVAGPLRDQHCGYVGLPPIGHGMGIPDIDVRASSLLSRHGFSPDGGYHRMTVRTAPYKPPVSREMMQLRRTTRAEKSYVLPQQGRYASAMSHIDIEHHQLINHRNGDRLANMRLWLSDPEAQVMNCSEAILDLSPIETQGQLTSSESFLIAALIQTLPHDWPLTELWQVLTGDAVGRADDHELTLFDSVGFAIEDFCALKFLYDATTGTDYFDTIDLIAEPANPKDLFSLVDVKQPASV